MANKNLIAVCCALPLFYSSIGGGLCGQEKNLDCVQCESLKLRKAPSYRIARRTRTTDAKSIIHISIDKNHFGRDDLIALACRLNKDFRGDGSVLVLIFDDYQSAKRYVSRWAQEKPKTWQRDEQSQRASYIRDPEKKMHSVAWYLDPLTKEGETKVCIKP